MARRGAAALVGLAVVLASMTLVWVVSLIRADTSIVDPFWGTGFAIMTAGYLVRDGRWGERGMLAFVLITAWVVRLGYHLL